MEEDVKKDNNTADDSVVKNEEQNIVSDADADTADISHEDGRISKTLDEIIARIDKMEGSLKSIRDTQSIMVENGATVREFEPSDYTSDGKDEFVPLDELDFSI